jgi:MOSC domain-containing protein YiiM
VTARIVSVSSRKGHGVGKTRQLSIRLLAGKGVEGDAHCGEAVKHRSRARFNPSLPNLRQVHLIHADLLDELRAKGFDIVPGELGENILTEGIDLLGLSSGARLTLGAHARIEITGLRNPCIQLERHRPGLMNAVLDRSADGLLIRKCGIMAIVLAGGDVQEGDAIAVDPVDGPHRPLMPV